MKVVFFDPDKRYCAIHPSVSSAARVLGRSPTTLHRWFRKGGDMIRLGRSYMYISPEEFKERRGGRRSTSFGSPTP